MKHSLKPQTSNLKPQTSNLKPQGGELFIRPLILLIFILFLNQTFLNAQPSCNDCKPTGGPTYKCISGAVSDLIISGDLLNVNDALTTPQYVVLDSDVRIDMDYTFTNGSILIVRNDKEIRVKETFELRIEDSEIRGCEYLWDGILLENRATIDISNSLIRDAKHAIHLHSGVDEYVNLTVENSEFRANYVSLNLSRRKYPDFNFDTEVAIFREEGIVSTDFLLNDLLLPDYSSQITDDYPKVGVYIKDLTEMEIGGSINYSGDGNTFNGIGPCSGVLCDDDPIQIAVYVWRTDTKIRNTKIDDIIFAVAGEGANVSPIRRVTFEGLGTGGLAPISMENVRNAFHIINMAVIVNGSKIQQGGIKQNPLMDFRSKSFEAGIYHTLITNNIITNATSPTIMFNNYVMNQGLLSNNIIYITNESYWSEVIGSTFPSIRKNIFSIYQNNIELPSTGDGSLFRGIRLTNQERTYVARNTIKGNTTRNRGNIWLENCEKIGVYKNNIIPTLGLQSSSGADGIYAYETRSSTYACNKIDNSYVGMKFSGDCVYSDIQKNRMEDNFQGLKLTNQWNTWVGPQPDRRNIWPETNSYSGGYEAISESPITNFSKFYVPQATNTNYWPDPYTPVNWFVNDDGPPGYPNLLQCQDTFVYDHEPHGPVDVGMGGNLVDPDDALITGVYNPDSIYGASLIRDAEFQLYDKMVNYPALISSSIDSEAWYDSMEISNLGIIYAVDQTLRTIGTFFGSDEVEFRNFQDSIELMEDYIQNLHDAIYNETNPSVRDSLILIRSSATLNLINLNTRGANFYEEWHEERMIDAADALDDINGITPVNTWETNFVILLRIQLESTISETWPDLSTNQMDSLDIVADQCRYLGGVSVVRARGITMGLEGFEVDEDEYCDPRSTSNFAQAQANVLPLIVYPNPAASTVNIQLPEEMGTFRLVVRDMLGKKYNDFFIQGTGESTYSLALNQLNAGMYNILLYCPDSKLYSTMLSVHK